MAKTWLTAIACVAIIAFGFIAGLSITRVNNLSQQRHADIEQERTDSIIRNCRDTNHRHDNAIGKLDALVQAIKNPQQRRRAERGIGGTVALIDALVPKQDCGALVRRSVNSRT